MRRGKLTSRLRNRHIFAVGEIVPWSSFDPDVRDWDSLLEAA